MQIRTATYPIRFILSYKSIPYRTKWVEYLDIEPLSKNLGIKPTGNNPDGTPFYTLPAIHNPSTGTYLAESFLIAEYLYPTPSIFSHGTKSLQYVFQNSFGEKIGFVRYFMLPL